MRQSLSASMLCHANKVCNATTTSLHSLSPSALLMHASINTAAIQAIMHPFEVEVRTIGVTSAAGHSSVIIITPTTMYILKMKYATSHKCSRPQLSHCDKLQQLSTMMHACSPSCSRPQLSHSDYSSNYVQFAADACMQSKLQQATAQSCINCS